MDARLDPSVATSATERACAPSQQRISLAIPRVPCWMWLTSGDPVNAMPSFTFLLCPGVNCSPSRRKTRLSSRKGTGTPEASKFQGSSHRKEWNKRQPAPALSRSTSRAVHWQLPCPVPVGRLRPPGSTACSTVEAALAPDLALSGSGILPSEILDLLSFRGPSSSFAAASVLDSAFRFVASGLWVLLLDAGVIEKSARNQDTLW
ncbi:hypothetical protein AXG93_4620s2300 [Marchantia polymorpha subsp. ruderalis]|uniref:Uncharacterized protein n=1 Tax=Marchantia polymorpha subsp. ruderalis TaxID=1480154 RepID=A0A176VYX9_MARPO|nr:hypothetical protein AXG93_4620s2300 [Marchantia polymorpha subsp. ruderalis]